LPAALLAHTFVFGRAHAIGGALSGAAMQAALGFAVLAAVLAGASAIVERRWRLPHAGALSVSASAWLAGLELVEARHAIPVLLCVLALAAAAMLLGCLVAAYTGTLAAIAVLAYERPNALRGSFAFRYAHTSPDRRRSRPVFELFSRPPPALS
jgi:hypothetical protein